MLWVFECADFSEFPELESNHFLGFEFEVGDAVKSWMRFGVGQKLRFFPEFLVSVALQLFKTPATLNEMTFLEKVYGDQFKHGWAVPLDDPEFNAFYKCIVGDDHISNNYNRSEVTRDSVGSGFQFGFWEFLRRHLESAHFEGQLVGRWQFGDDMDSDAVFADLLENEDGDRAFIDEEDSNIAVWAQSEFGRRALMELKEAVFRWKQIRCGPAKDGVLGLGLGLGVRDCPHFEVVVRHLMAFQECGHEIDATNLWHFDLNQVLESFDHIVSVHGLLTAENREEIIRYVTSQVVCGCASTECGVLRKAANRKRESERTEEEEGHSMDTVDPVERECAVMTDAMNSVHSLFLHRDSSLQRDATRNRFGTEVVEIEETKEHEVDDEKQLIYALLSEHTFLRQNKAESV